MSFVSRSSTLIAGGCGLALVSALAFAAPSFAATQSGDTSVSATVSASITLSAPATAAIAVTPAAGHTTMSSVVVAPSVSTNNSSGYKLTLETKTSTVTLVSGSNSIAASSGTPGSPAALTAGKWGYRVDGVSSFGAGPTVAETNSTTSTTTFAGVPASGSPVTVKTTSTTASSDTTDVVFGAAVDSTQPTGAYTQTVTFTAITNV